MKFCAHQIWVSEKTDSTGRRDWEYKREILSVDDKNKKLKFKYTTTSGNTGVKTCAFISMYQWADRWKAKPIPEEIASSWDGWMAGSGLDKPRVSLRQAVYYGRYGEVARGKIHAYVNGEGNLCGTSLHLNPMRDGQWEVANLYEVTCERCKRQFDVHHRKTLGSLLPGRGVQTPSR